MLDKISNSTKKATLCICWNFWESTKIFYYLQSSKIPPQILIVKISIQQRKIAKV